MRATLYASALGVYSIELEGARVGDDWLAPGWTDYAKRIPYRAYDVTALVRAGEASGLLDQALERTERLLTRSVQMRETIISALLYPAILVSVAILSIGLMLKFVVPQFATLFEGTEVSLPWITQFVLWASGGVRIQGSLPMQRPIRGDCRDARRAGNRRVLRTILRLLPNDAPSNSATPGAQSNVALRARWRVELPDPRYPGTAGCVPLP